MRARACQGLVESGSLSPAPTGLRDCHSGTVGEAAASKLRTATHGKAGLFTREQSNCSSPKPRASHPRAVVRRAFLLRAKRVDALR